MKKASRICFFINKRINFFGKRISFIAKRIILELEELKMSPIDPLPSQREYTRPTSSGQPGYTPPTSIGQNGIKTLPGQPGYTPPTSIGQTGINPLPGQPGYTPPTSIDQTGINPLPDQPGYTPPTSIGQTRNTQPQDSFTDRVQIRPMGFPQTGIEQIEGHDITNKEIEAKGYSQTVEQTLATARAAAKTAAEYAANAQTAVQTATEMSNAAANSAQTAAEAAKDVNKLVQSITRKPVGLTATADDATQKANAATEAAKAAQKEAAAAAAIVAETPNLAAQAAKATAAQTTEQAKTLAEAVNTLSQSISTSTDEVAKQRCACITNLATQALQTAEELTAAVNALAQSESTSENWADMTKWAAQTAKIAEYATQLAREASSEADRLGSSRNQEQVPIADIAQKAQAVAEAAKNVALIIQAKANEAAEQASEAAGQANLAAKTAQDAANTAQKAMAEAEKAKLQEQQYCFACAMYQLGITGDYQGALENSDLSTIVNHLDYSYDAETKSYILIINDIHGKPTAKIVMPKDDAGPIVDYVKALKNSKDINAYNISAEQKDHLRCAMIGSAIYGTTRPEASWVKDPYIDSIYRNDYTTVSFEQGQMPMQNYLNRVFLIAVAKKELNFNCMNEKPWFSGDKEEYQNLDNLRGIMKFSFEKFMTMNNAERASIYPIYTSSPGSCSPPYYRY